MNKGNYLLILHLLKTGEIAVGKKIKHVFTEGYYIYIGSAYGPGGLQKRLERHFSKEKKIYWHIDYFLQHSKLIEAWTIAPAISLEHEIAEFLHTIPDFKPAYPHFGSSDCNCPTHLFKYGRKPIISEINKLLKGMVYPNRFVIFKI